MVLAQRPECARVAASSLAKRPTRRTINSKNAKSGVNNPGFKTKHRSMASFRRCPAYNGAADHVGEREGGFLPAAISFAGCVQAKLGALRRIDCIKADAFAADLYGVTIDDGGGALCPASGLLRQIG